MKGFSQIGPDRNPKQRPRTIELCFIHEFAGKCYEFLWHLCLGKPRALKMSRIKQSRSVGWTDNPLLKASCMANPHLPFAANRRYLHTAWVNVGWLDIKPTETARVPFNSCHNEPLSAASRAAITAPRLASSTTGARCRYLVWAVSASGVPEKSSPRWN